VGGLPNFFPYSFKVARLRMDLKRHVQDAIVSHGARFLPPMTLVVSRRAPLAAAYRGVALAPLVWASTFHTVILQSKHGSIDDS
jgi:hypothetical protein